MYNTNSLSDTKFINSVNFIHNLIVKGTTKADSTHRDILTVHVSVYITFIKEKGLFFPTLKNKYEQSKSKKRNRK